MKEVAFQPFLTNQKRLQGKMAPPGFQYQMGSQKNYMLNTGLALKYYFFPLGWDV